MIINQTELDACWSGKIGSPHDFLGLHEIGPGLGLVARALDPGADQVSLVDRSSDTWFPMNKIHPDGFFEAEILGKEDYFPYSFCSVHSGIEVE